MATRMEISIDDAIDAAAARLGYEEVKSEQREAVRAIVNEKDVFVSLPTGYGKSLCYAMLPFVFDSVLSRPSSSACRHLLHSCRTRRRNLHQGVLLLST